MTKDEAKKKITELVAKYKRLPTSEVKAFNEANTKQAFILPLFCALGWDVNETKEVTMEEAASGGRVDFAFKLNGVAQFYLEAKKFSADLNNPEHMKQATTYAYGNSVTWAVLTNFEELRLLNAQKSTPFITLIHDDYVKDFDKLWLLSRESLVNGLLSKEATQYGALPKLIPVEERLFKQLRLWRTELYNQLFHHNEWLKPEQRDEIIEKLFNRLIFIRTCEDRKLEEHQLLSAFRQWQKGGNKKDELSAALRKIFDYYRGYYDSDLFESHLLDDSRVFIYDDTIAKVLTGLYDIPGGMASYDFAIIDADVLGRVYEQYLGYVAKAVVEKIKEAQAKLSLGFAIDTDYELLEKKQHRKEQGIYYTPKFVTDYIVKETVQRFIKENEHDGYNKILNMKILDPACGSGSFLIRAYDELLNYHARVRSKTVSDLGQNDRLPILTRNIFGVDLDIQAVEITRLNLLLRSLAKRETLPSLADDIRQGNSLISGSDKELKGYFGNNWRQQKPFDWEGEFKDIISEGGFDVIIGNPPYLRVSGINEDVDQYIRSHYETIFGHFDYYIAFLERSVKLLRDGGLLGFIVPNKFLVRSYAKRFRLWLLDNARILRLVDFSSVPVFEDASVYPVVIILTRITDKVDTHTSVSVAKMTPETFTAFLTTGDIQYSDVDQDGFRANKYCTFDISIIGEDGAIFRRIEYRTEPLGAFAKVLTGTPAIKLFYKWGDLLAPQKSVGKKEKALPFINVSNVSRYAISWGKEIRAAKKRLSTPYLRFHSEYVGENKWSVFSINPKIVVAGTARCLTAALDRVGYSNLSLYAVVEWESKRSYNINYLLGLINSTLLNFWFTRKFGSTRMSGGYITYNGIYLEQLPIPMIDLANPAQKKQHDNLVVLVDKMLELNKKLALIRETYCNERDELIKEIDKTDKEIDNLVYALYGLTEDERKIVEATV